MEIKQILTIKNKLGIMQIQIKEIIPQTKDSSILNQIGNLGSFESLRLEFYEEGFITVYSREYKNIIYLIQPPFDFGVLKVYKCEILETEKPEFDLTRIEVE